MITEQGKPDLRAIVEAVMQFASADGKIYYEADRAMHAVGELLGREQGKDAGWISVEERLPDKDCRVEVWRGTSADSMRVELQWYMKRGPWDSGFFDDGEQDTNVTHWRELPAAPGASLQEPKS